MKTVINENNVSSFIIHYLKTCILCRFGIKISKYINQTEIEKSNDFIILLHYWNFVNLSLKLTCHLSSSDVTLSLITD